MFFHSIETCSAVVLRSQDPAVENSIKLKKLPRRAIIHATFAIAVQKDPTMSKATLT